ncbi:hypothetical protein BG015_004795 [Linnemannia schmuckeri]|uniref:Uncharacterized protein n=1 Tax=Linnemannia schmuckeri TaxID=64567 RepID=A0A9P5VCD1_9FUNG|nr:hypothetical protein BG015_004795 [Linnemannia schmuckeri]
MSTHVTRTRVLLALTRISRSYSSTAASTNTSNTQQPKTAPRISRGPTIPRKPRIQDLSNDMPPRSFLLDLPTRPTPKRLSPAKREHEALTSFEKKVANNPYAFLTKFIQAAGPNDQPWIVPERILPHAITKKPTPSAYQDDPRNGFGKWMTTTSAVIDSVIREGRYKMINTAAFMRQDMSKLVYAQWSIRVAHEFKVLYKTSFTKETKKQPTLRRPRFIVMDGSHAHPPGGRETSESSGTSGVMEGLGPILGFRSAQRIEVPCVLYFGKGLQLTSGMTSKDASAVSKETKKSNETKMGKDWDISVPRRIPATGLLEDLDITKPNLPVFAKDRQPTHEQMEIWQSSGRRFKSSVYDMERLFEHHPQGLEVIKQKCLELLPTAQVPSTDKDATPMWLGVRGSRETIPICIGLWKMASI